MHAKWLPQFDSDFRPMGAWARRKQGVQEEHRIRQMQRI